MAYDDTNYEIGVDFDNLTVGDTYDVLEKIANTIIETVEGKNPFAVLNKGKVETGVIVEQIVAKLATAYAFDNTAVDVFTKTAPDLVVRYFKDWTENQYSCTIEEQEIKRIVGSADNLSKLAGVMIASMTNSHDNDIYQTMLGLMTDVANDATPIQTEVTLSATPSAEELITAIRDTIKTMTFCNNTYCPAGFVTKSAIENIMLAIPYKVLNKLDVTKLANVYNLEKADLMGHIIETDQADNYIFIFDKNAFGWYTRMLDVTSERNQKGHYTNYWLTAQELPYFSPLFNSTFIDADLFVNPTP
jgi:hypothetical protein